MQDINENYILESKIEYLQNEVLKLKQDNCNLKKVIKHILEGKNIPEKIKNMIDI